MICKKCGEKIGSDLAECPFCGEKYDYWFTKRDTQSSDSDNSGSTTTYNPFLMPLTVIAGILCVVGLFLPFLGFEFLGSSSSVSFRDIGSKDFSIFFIAGVVGLIAGVFKQFLFSAIAGGVYAGFFFYDTKDINELIGLLKGEFFNRGIGYYCMLVGCVALLVLGIWGFMVKYNNRQR